MKDLVMIAEEFGFQKLNSYTKYPSIETYHEIDRGILKENLTNNVGFAPDDKLEITEKIDGTNGRILVLNGDYMIGSREELLYRKGDIFGNPSQGIVDVMKPIAEAISVRLPHDDTLYVFYGEVYGGGINGSKQYTGHKKAAVRLFDITTVNINSAEFLLAIGQEIEMISIWREHGNQPFLPVQDFLSTVTDLGFANVPYRNICHGSDIPADRAGAYEWLCKFTDSTAILDEDGGGRAEGVVIRNQDRSMIRKLRFEDYEKTKRKLGNL